MVRDWTPFQNSARKDGLILRHWRREGEAPPVAAGLPVTPADSNAASEMDADDKDASGIQDSIAAKWNVKIARPTYSDEEYDVHLKNEGWSKEETDYLVDLAVDFDLRWIVVADRYDYKPSARQSPSAHTMDVDGSPQPAVPRTMEDLKARYYTVAAKCMSLRTPLSSMNPSEFDTYEKMTKFDPKRETVRKQYTDKLLLRTQQEANDEERLLKELQRIVLDQEKLFEDRKALYDRLEAPRAINTAAAQASTTIYQSSQGLHQLMQSMMQTQRLKASEQREKRRSALGIDTENANHQAMVDSRGHRASLGSASALSDKRQSHSAPQRSSLPHVDRAKFGVHYPQERLVSGVQFRHERVIKASQAKSAVQTSRITDALAELNIPPRLVMPTSKVVAEYERMVEGVKTLVEVRKMREKVEGEIRIFSAQKNMTYGDGTFSEVNGDASKAELQEELADEDDTQDQPKEEEQADSDEEMEDSQVNNDEAEHQQDTVAAPLRNGHTVEAGEEGDSGEDDDGEGDVEDEGEEGDKDRDADEDEEEEEEDEDEDAEGSDVSQEAAEADADVEEDNADDASQGAEEDRPSSADDEDEEEDAVAEDDTGLAGARSVRKRSASVVSILSSKSSKRQRK